MNIVGMQKVTLLDYPDKVAAIIFTEGCNFRCPFCQNSSLIDKNVGNEYISSEEVLKYLEKRKGVIDGLVISGGEPTMQHDLKDFIKKVKDIGMLVKLDTNGFNSKILKELIDENLVDYVAMDIKNEMCKYSVTCGLNQMKIDNIKESIQLLENSSIDYEFRTTIMKEYHDIESIKMILELIGDKPKYFLQNFRLSENVLDKNIHGFTIDELKSIQRDLKEKYHNVKIRDLMNENEGDKVYV